MATKRQTKGQMFLASASPRANHSEEWQEVFRLIDGMVPVVGGEPDVSLLDAFIAHQDAVRVAVGGIVPYPTKSFKGVPLKSVEELFPVTPPLCDPYTNDVLGPDGGNPARNREFPVSDTFAMRVHGYVAAWRLANGMSRDDLDAVFTSMRAADEIGAALKAPGFAASTYRTWVKRNVLPTLSEAAITLAALVTAPDGPEARRIAEIAEAQIRHRHVGAATNADGPATICDTSAGDHRRSVVLLGGINDRELVRMHLHSFVKSGVLWDQSLEPLCTEAQVRERVASAKVVIVLLRAEYMNTAQFRMCEELFKARRLVVPVRMAPVDLAGSPLVGAVGFPLNSGHANDSTFVELATDLRKTLARFGIHS